MSTFVAALKILLPLGWQRPSRGDAKTLRSDEQLIKHRRNDLPNRWLMNLFRLSASVPLLYLELRGLSKGAIIEAF